MVFVIVCTYPTRYRRKGTYYVTTTIYRCVSYAAVMCTHPTSTHRETHTYMYLTVVVCMICVSLNTICFSRKGTYAWMCYLMTLLQTSMNHKGNVNSTFPGCARGACTLNHNTKSNLNYMNAYNYTTYLFSHNILRGIHVYKKGVSLKVPVGYTYKLYRTFTRSICNFFCCRLVRVFTLRVSIGKVHYQKKLSKSINM